MAWQVFFVYANGSYLGKFEGLTREEALKHYQALFPSEQLEVL
jgi:hypothetical protein